jgi:hypothetical protein
MVAWADACRACMSVRRMQANKCSRFWKFFFVRVFQWDVLWSAGFANGERLDVYLFLALLV